MTKEPKNISDIDLLIANFNYIKNMFVLLLNFSRTYNDFANVIKYVLRKKYPVDAVLRNVKCVRLTNFNTALFLSEVRNQEQLFEYDIDNDVVVIHSDSMVVENKKIKLIGGITNGDVIGVFLKNEYKDLPVKGRTIIDIGSNIGDSLLFFSSKEADKIIGLEPFPKNYEKARKNIEINNFSDKVTILLAGCSDISGHITIDPDYDSGVDSKIDQFSQGVSVPLLTLKNILDDYSVPKDSILKMDCEGCEYKSILTTPNEVFERFSHIIVEYHNGYKNLKRKLENAGFKVSVKKPTASGFISSYLFNLKKFLMFKNSSVKTDQINYLGTNKQIKVFEKHQIEYHGLIHAVRK